MGKSAPKLHAEISNGFTSALSSIHYNSSANCAPLVVWVAQGFAAVPVLFTFFKYRADSASKGKF